MSAENDKKRINFTKKNQKSASFDLREFGQKLVQPTTINKK